jgi:hypothetical protein
MPDKPKTNLEIEMIKDQFIGMTSDLIENIREISPSNVDGNLIREIRKNVEFISQNF